MTKKDYTKIANVLAKFEACKRDNGQVYFMAVVVALANMFSKDNPRFDRVRFYGAVCNDARRLL